MADQTYSQAKGTNVDERVEKDKKWERVQIKAFSSWVNSALISQGIEPVDDIKIDFQDGVKLVRFLEIISKKSVGKYDKKPAQKIQKIQNLSIALNFIADKLNVRLVGVGPEDVYDGNLKLILGMLWTLFRTLRIMSIKEEGKSSEDALLLWVKKMTDGYPGINITNFKESFNDGLAFSALINKFDPKLLNFTSLNPGNREENLEGAFSIAESNLGIPKLLDVSDLVAGNPDERSVILYVSLFFHAFVAAGEKAKQDAAAENLTNKITDLNSQLEMLTEENEELQRSKRSFADRITELEKEGLTKDSIIKEQDEKLKLLEDELEYMRQRALQDAETIALLEQKNKLLQELLEREDFEKGELEEARARLLAELDELRKRSKELASENESLDDMKKRLITDVSSRDGVLASMDARKNALQNEIEQLKKFIAAEIEKRKAAVRSALQLKKELEDLKKKLIAQGKARVGLDILRKNLEEHLEDMYRWRELHELDPEDQKRVFDLDKVIDDLKEKSFEQQLEYLDEQLQAENKNLLRIIRLKDSQFKLKEVEVKSGWLSMKGRKDWKRRWFSLRGFTLFYFESETSQKYEGFVDLNKGCEVVRQKAVKEDDSAKKQWPLKITVGDRKLFVRAATKKERHSWYLFLASKIAHLNYMKSVDASGARADTRLITLFQSESVTDLHLDHRPISAEGCIALGKTLPAHDETEYLSLSNVGLTNSTVKHIADVLEKLSIKSLNLSNNKISSTDDLAKGIANNISLTELNLENNELDNAAVANLATNIASKPALTNVNLAGNKISADGVHSIVEHFGNAERTLPELNLARNQLDDSAAVEIANLLKANPTIVNVNLSGNKIGNRGVSAIFNTLGADSNVQTIDLSNNEIGNEGAIAVDKFLKVNHNVLSVNLSNNKNIVGSSEIATLLKEGYHFPHLSFSRVI